MQVAYPYKVNGAGRTDHKGTEEDHIRDLLEQVLFTVPGERLNQPDFGTGLMQFVFAGNGDETLVALQFLIQGALQKWMGDLIELDAIQIVSDDSKLSVTIGYRVIRTQNYVVAQFKS